MGPDRVDCTVDALVFWVIWDLHMYRLATENVGMDLVAKFGGESEEG